MTICKKVAFFSKGAQYKKRDIMPSLENSEQQASHFYDAEADIICSFFNGNSDEWDNVPTAHTFEYKRKAGGALAPFPAWEQTKRRYIFFRDKDCEEFCYRYLGETIGETRKTVGKDEYVVYDLKP
jgi:hypothetical protein